MTNNEKGKKPSPKGSKQAPPPSAVKKAPAKAAPKVNETLGSTFFGGTIIRPRAPNPKNVEHGMDEGQVGPYTTPAGSKLNTPAGSPPSSRYSTPQPEAKKSPPDKKNEGGNNGPSI